MASKKEDRVQFEEIPGNELLKPVSELKASQRMRVASKLMAALKDGGEFDFDDFDVIVDYMEFLEDNGYVVDEDGWNEFFEENGMEGVVALIASYAGEAIGAKQ